LIFDIVHQAPRKYDEFSFRPKIITGCHHKTLGFSRCHWSSIGQAGYCQMDVITRDSEGVSELKQTHNCISFKVSFWKHVIYFYCIGDFKPILTIKEGLT